MQKSELIKSKQHYEILDGLRGVAALSVVVFHFLEFVYPDYKNNPFGHSFLAVDFFFCLSGFVIAYAYDDRIGKMGVLEFLKSRLIRLHPLVIIGSVLGLIGYFLIPFGETSRNILDVALLFICSIFLIPMPIMKERFGNLFGLNAPSWSLFWEYIANIFYAIILCKLQKKYLVVLAILSAIAIAYVGYSAGNLMGGWGGETFWHGGARVSYSFLAGILVYRFKWILSSKLSFYGLSVLLIVSLLMPFFQWNSVVETIIILLYFPLLVALGAGAKLSETTKKICVFSGNISYPLYMIHYFAIWFFGTYYTANKITGFSLIIVISVGTLVLIALAYLIMKYIDVPVRNYLTARRKLK